MTWSVPSTWADGIIRHLRIQRLPGIRPAEAEVLTSCPRLLAFRRHPQNSARTPYCSSVRVRSLSADIRSPSARINPPSARVKRSSLPKKVDPQREKLHPPCEKVYLQRENSILHAKKSIRGVKNSIHRAKKSIRSVKNSILHAKKSIRGVKTRSTARKSPSAAGKKSRSALWKTPSAHVKHPYSARFYWVFLSREWIPQSLDGPDVCSFNLDCAGSTALWIVSVPRPDQVRPLIEMKNLKWKMIYGKSRGLTTRNHHWPEHGICHFPY